MTDKKVEPIQADDIYQLADAINEFSKTADIFSTQIYQRDKGYDCLIWYNLNKPENIFKVNTNIPQREEPKEEEPMTKAQWGKLKSLGINPPKGMTKREAILMIKRAVGEQDG